MWTVLGFVLADVAVLSVVAWLLLRQRDQRIQDAERSAAEAARNAEVAAMTRGLAHEIKNPLSTVVLNAQLLREEIMDADLPAADNDRMLRRVDALAREANRLSDVLNDFLRYAGRLQLDPRRTDLRDVVHELADFFAPQAEQAGVALQVEVPPQPVEAVVDPSLVKQVLLNLMINAVQAMQRPGQAASGQAAAPESSAMRLTISVLPPDPRARKERPYATLRVADTGPGVPAQVRSRIFDPYVTTRPGGNGLGLSTARRIVEAHGGRIALLDRPGAVFEVTLPLEGPPPTPTSPSS